MKETGIIMSGDHPRKILDGTKTMTRRIHGLEEINKDPDNWQLEWFNPNTGIAIFARGDVVNDIYEVTDLKVKCPYGHIGDQLWVRERHCIECYKNDGVQDVCYYFDEAPPDESNDCDKAKWKPSIHMYRWASRIQMPISLLRPERLREITEEDVRAEGIEGTGEFFVGYVNAFAMLWDFLNAKRGYSWEFNPWVWVIGWPKFSFENT